MAHNHIFLGEKHAENERKTWLVIALTGATMLAEIIGGMLSGSMALTADGWHMMTHAGALGISALAYTYARQHKDDPRFTFGTGKLGELAGFASALILGVIALIIAGQAIDRLLSPAPIAFGEALAIAVLGLIVNIVSVFLLNDKGHVHDHDAAVPHHHDNNLRSAYVHVMADAATSVLAIAGLSLGWAYGWTRIDACVGIVGSVVIASWSWTLIRATGRVLLDITPDQQIVAAIRQILESDGDLITDLHLWQVGIGHYSAIISLISDNPQAPDSYKNRLSSFDMLSHITIEIQSTSKI